MNRQQRRHTKATKAGVFLALTACGVFGVSEPAFAWHNKGKHLSAATKAKISQSVHKCITTGNCKTTGAKHVGHPSTSSSNTKSSSSTRTASTSTKHKLPKVNIQMSQGQWVNQDSGMVYVSDTNKNQVNIANCFPVCP